MACSDMATVWVFKSCIAFAFWSWNSLRDLVCSQAIMDFSFLMKLSEFYLNKRTDQGLGIKVTWCPKMPILLTLISGYWKYPYSHTENRPKGGNCQHTPSVLKLNSWFIPMFWRAFEKYFWLQYFEALLHKRPVDLNDNCAFPQYMHYCSCAIIHHDIALSCMPLESLQAF